MSNTGIRIGGIEGRAGEQVVASLRGALNEAIKRGQNEVAKAIAAELGRLGETKGVTVANANVQMRP